MVVEAKHTGAVVDAFSVRRGDVTLVPPAEATDTEPYFLSNLDQNIAVLVQTVYCFRASAGRDPAEVIREALAKVLVQYHPLAGRLSLNAEWKLFVNCTGEGAVFVEAEAGCELAAIGDVAKPDPAVLGELVYNVPGATNILEIPPLVAQVTKFKCGGFTLGLSMNHCMFDGIGAMEFVASWAETARGALPLSTPPSLDRSIFAARAPPAPIGAHPEFDQIELVSGGDNAVEDDSTTLVYQSFPFDATRLDRLKKKALNSGDLASCTSFEALSGYVWRSRTAALNMPPEQKTKLLFAVDVRRRMDPPVPKGYSGNAMLLTCATETSGDLLSKPLAHATELVQAAAKKVTDEYVRSAVDYFEMTRARPSLAATAVITMWSRLAFESADFGWGEPAQAGPVTLPQKEVVLFLANGKEKGFNVLVGLPEPAMAKFKVLMEEI